MARVQPLVCRDMYGAQRGDADHRMSTRTLAPHCTGRSLCGVLCGGQCSLSSFVLVLVFDSTSRNSYAASVGVWPLYFLWVRRRRTHGVFAALSD